MISGLAVPYGVVARQGGLLYSYSRGLLVWDQVKLLIQHDHSQIVGRAVELTETDEGLFARFRVAHGPAGARALALAEVYTGLSIGIDGSHKERDGIYYPVAGSRLIEVSLTPTPVFDTARIRGEP